MNFQITVNNAGRISRPVQRLPLLFFLALMSLSVSAQNFQWAKKFSGGGYSNGTHIALDASGNSYSTGFFNGTVDFDPGSGVHNLTASGQSDVYISRMDASGNFAWAKSLGGADYDNGRSIAVDNNGNVYVTGYFELTADFDPGSSTFNMTSAGEQDAFILKLDTAGNLKWAKRIGHTGTEMGVSLAVDASGSVYIAGFFEETVDFDPGPGTLDLVAGFHNRDIFILKLDFLGDLVWARSMGGTDSDYPFGLALDGMGNVLTTGTFRATVDFDPGSGIANLTAGSDDIFILKLSASGNYIWARKIGGSANDEATSIALDIYGNPYITGNFSGTADFDPGSGTANLSSAGATDIFVAKLSADGFYRWAKNMGGTVSDYGNSIAVDSAGNAHIAGWFNGTADLDPGPAVSSLVSAGSVDIFILKLDSSGGFKWAHRMGGTNIDIGSALVLDAKGSNMYYTGYFNGTSDFDPGPVTYNMSATGFEIFVSKFCLLPSFAVGVSGPTTVCQGATASYSTGTSTGATSYTWTVPSGATIVSGQNTTTIVVAFGMSAGSIMVTPANACGNGPVSAISVSVNAYPVITIEPIDQSANSGSDVLFIAGVTSGSATYRWQQDTGAGFTDLSNGGQYSGAQNDTLKVSQITDAQHNYEFRCIVTVGGCSDTSRHAILTVSNVGIKKVSSETGFSVYPNPSFGSFTIQSTQKGAFTIQNELGQVIDRFELNEENNFSLQLELQAKAVYFITGLNQGQFFRKKIIVF